MSHLPISADCARLHIAGWQENLLPVLISQNSAVLPAPRFKLLLRFLNGSEFGLPKAFEIPRYETVLGLAHLVLTLGPWPDAQW
jgi:hypothetical protein